MPLAALCLALISSPDQAKVTLTHKFAANEKLAYNFNAHLQIERRQQGLETWIPFDEDIKYGYTLHVQAMKNEGFASVKFMVPTITDIEGESYDSVPKPTVEKVNWTYLFTLSPVNEVVDVKDLTPKKKKPVAKDNLVAPAPAMAPVLQGGFMGTFLQEVHRLASFVGSMDIAPPLPLEPVKVGDTWKRTVGYQPQKLKGSSKSAVQRLDYTYTYQGPMQSNGKQVLRIQAKLNLETDLGDFLRSILAESDQADNPEIKEAIGKLTMPLKLNATIDFDLDPKTGTTLASSATSDGGFQYNMRKGDDAVFEERFKGRSTVDLVGRKIVPLTAADKP